MKKYFLLIVLYGLISSCLKKNVYYVSKNGDDANSGSKMAPFATISRALNTISLKKQDGNTGMYKIYLRAGIYELENTLVFDPKLSGTENNPLVIAAYENERVALSGGKTFEYDDLKIVGEKVQKQILNIAARNKIRSLDLKQKNILEYGEIKHTGFCRPILSAGIELFQGETAFTLASWPTDKYIKVGKVIDSGSKPRNNDFSAKGGVFEYKSSHPSSWKNTKDLWVQGMFGTVWADDKLKVASIDTLNRTIHTEKPYLYGISGGHFKFINVLSEITKPGDYYIDRERGIAYLYPINKESVSVSIMEDPLVSIEGADYIQFENIIFENGRGLGAYCENGNYNLFQNCIFRNFGSYAVSFGKGIAPFRELRHEGIGELQKWIVGSLRQHIYADVTINRQAGTNNGLKACKIYNIGAGGVSLGGGDVKNLIPANNYVEECEIFHTGLRYQTYSPGIDLTGVGNRISNCRIYDSPHSAIIYYGNEHIIEGSEIFDVLLESDDGGAIYTGRDVTAMGTIIRNNYIHHVGSHNPLYHHGYWQAIYLDDYAGKVSIHDNVFTDMYTGVLVSGRNIVCRNNIFVNCERSIAIQHRAWHEIQDRRLEQVDAFGTVWKEKYPKLQKIQTETTDDKGKFWGTKSINNIAIGSVNPCTVVDRVDSAYLTIRGELNYAANEIDELFVNAQNGNFNLSDNSKIILNNPYFQRINFDHFIEEK